MPCVGLFGPVGTKPVGALTLPKEIAGLGIEPLTEGFKVFRFYFASQIQKLRAAALPMPHHAVAFGIIVGTFEIPGRISFAVGHRSDRKHSVI